MRSLPKSRASWWWIKLYNNWQRTLWRRRRACWSWVEGINVSLGFTGWKRICSLMIRAVVATCLEGALKIKEVSYMHSEGVSLGCSVVVVYQALIQIRSWQENWNMVPSRLLTNISRESVVSYRALHGSFHGHSIISFAWCNSAFHMRFLPPLIHLSAAN